MASQLQMQIKQIGKRVLSVRKSIKQLRQRKKMLKRSDYSGRKRIDDQIFSYLTRINSLRQQRQSLQIRAQATRKRRK